MRDTMEMELQDVELEPVSGGNLWKELFCWNKGDNRGVGVVEIILILVVLIALVVIFKDQLTDLVSDLLDSITRNAKKI